MEKNGHVCSQNSYIVMLERIIAQIVLLEEQASLFKQADFSIIDLKKQTNKNKKTRQFWQNIMTNFVQNIIVCKFTKQHLDSVDGSLSGKTAFFSNILLKWYMFMCSYNPKNGSWDSIDIIVCQISRQWELKQERL